MTTLYVLLVLAAPADDPLERARHLAAALPNHGPLLVEVALAEGGDAARKQLVALPQSVEVAQAYIELGDLTAAHAIAEKHPKVEALWTALVTAWLARSDTEKALQVALDAKDVEVRIKLLRALAKGSRQVADLDQRAALLERIAAATEDEAVHGELWSAWYIGGWYSRARAVAVRLGKPTWVKLADARLTPPKPAPSTPPASTPAGKTSAFTVQGVDVTGLDALVERADALLRAGRHGDLPELAREALELTVDVEEDEGAHYDAPDEESPDAELVDYVDLYCNFPEADERVDFVSELASALVDRQLIGLAEEVLGHLQHPATASEEQAYLVREYFDQGRFAEALELGEGMDHPRPGDRCDEEVWTEPFGQVALTELAGSLAEAGQYERAAEALAALPASDEDGESWPHPLQVAATLVPRFVAAGRVALLVALAKPDTPGRDDFLLALVAARAAAGQFDAAARLVPEIEDAETRVRALIRLGASTRARAYSGTSTNPR